VYRYRTCPCPANTAIDDTLFTSYLSCAAWSGILCWKLGCRTLQLFASWACTHKLARAGTGERLRTTAGGITVAGSTDRRAGRSRGHALAVVLHTQSGGMGKRAVVGSARRRPAVGEEHKVGALALDQGGIAVHGVPGGALSDADLTVLLPMTVVGYARV